MKRQKMTMSTLYCETCNHPFTIARRTARQREPGHMKHMYCAFCKKKKGFIETKEETTSFWDDWHTQHMPTIEN